MSIDHSKLYENARDYFDLGGDVVMKLSRDAAIDVCRQAGARGLLVVRIEGGIRRPDRTFEARLDAIWDGAEPPINPDKAEQNNTKAADFIRSQTTDYNAFIITDAPLTGYRHREVMPGPGKALH
jgi:hypothetical protein